MQQKSTTMTWLVLLAALVGLAILIALSLNHFKALFRSVATAEQPTTSSSEVGASGIENKQSQTGSIAAVENSAQRPGNATRPSAAATMIEGSDNPQEQTAAEPASSETVVAQKTESLTDSGSQTASSQPPKKPMTLQLADPLLPIDESDTESTVAEGSEPAESTSVKNTEQPEQELETEPEVENATSSDTSTDDASTDDASTDNASTDNASNAVDSPGTDTKNEDKSPATAGEASDETQGPVPVEAAPVEPLPDMSFVLVLRNGSARVSGLLTDTPNNRKVLASLNDTGLQVVDVVEYVDRSSGRIQELDDGLANTLAELDVEHASLSLTLDNDSLRVTGGVTSEEKQQRLRLGLSDFLQASVQKTLASKFAADQPAGDLALDLQVSVEALEKPTLVILLSEGTIASEGILDDGQRSELESIVAKFDDYSSNLDYQRRVADVTILNELGDLLIAAVDSLNEGRIEISEAKVGITGQVISGDPDQLSVQFRQLLPPAIEFVSELQAVVVEPPVDPLVLERQRAIDEIADGMALLQFSEGSTDLDDASTAILDQLFEVLFLYDELRVSLRVHSNDAEKSVDKLLLSRIRANTMSKYLFERGLEQYRVAAIGLGDTQLDSLLVSNSELAARIDESAGTIVELRFLGP